MKPSLFPLLLLLALFLAPNAMANGLKLNNEKEAFLAGSSLMILEDKDGILTIDDVSQPELAEKFEPSKAKVPNFGFTTSVYWAKLTLSNDHPKRSEWLVEISYPLIDSIELYTPNEDGSFDKHLTGDRLTFDQRDVQYHNFVFNVHAASGKTTDLYFRFKTESSMQMPITVHSSKGFTELVNTQQYGLGLYYGIMLSMVIYNLFIYLAVKDQSYLHYVLFILVYVFFQMSLNGLAYEYLWPNWPWWANRGTPILESLTMVFAITFAIYYLNLKQLQPRLNKTMLIFLGLEGVAILTSFFSYSIGIKVATLLAIVGIILITIAGTQGIRQGYRPAIYYLLAWAALIVGALVFALKAFGVLPSNVITDNFLQIGSALEVLLLSLGLADRINVMRKEKFLAEREAKRATEEALEHLKKADELKAENLRIVQEQNQILEGKVQERTAAIRDLMDNTGQGFLTFGQDYRINREYSKACETFFGQPLVDLDAIKFLMQYCETHTEKEVREIADMLLTGQSPMMLVEILLPKQIKVAEKILSLEFKLIESEGDESEIKIMVILTDITQEVKLAAQIKADEERQAIIVKVATDKNGFIRFLGELDELFSSTYGLLSGGEKDFDSNALFRNYHTIKGGAASYGMKKVAEKAHEVENLLSPLQRGEEPFSKAKQDELRETTHEIENLLQSALSDINDIIPPEERSDKSLFYRVSSDKVVELERFMLGKIGEEHLQIIKRQIDHLIAQPIAPLLRKYATNAEELGSRLGKPVQVEILGGNTEVPFQKLDSFFATFIHLVRNSVDHGLEGLEQRQILGKPEEGRVTLEAKKENDELTLIVKDDGRGINAQKIKEIAAERGVITAEEAQNMDENQALALIFAPGFSTKEEVTDVSGRGVGMDAVKAAVKQLKGKISIQTKINEGSTFEIRIPLAG